ncbi:hypothetical protein BZZ01_09955 [Nostocales cyanobacterium HT-58-2]|nr:hypothetical protein BZZ01_09955 [Nostocales cyanobacterium HT-58-2]
MKFFKTICQSIVLVTFLLLYSHTAAAVTVEQTNFSDKVTVQPTSEIKLKLDRLPNQNEGRLAIFIGQTDVTSLFRTVGNELIYQPKDVPLPVGENKLIVYLVKENNEWQEIAQLPLKVSDQPLAEQPTDSKVTQAPTQTPSRTRGGTEPTQIPATTQEQTQQTQQTQTQQTQPPSTTQEQTQPTQTQPSQESTPGAQPSEQPTQPQSQGSETSKRPTLTLQSQFLEARSGEIPPKPTSTKLTFEGDFNRQDKIGELNIRSVFSVFGTTLREEAIRFQQLGQDAPNLDLNSYDIDLTYGSTTLSLGQGNCYGNHRFLLEQICNRGLVLSSKLGDRLDITLASTSATDIVGYDNILGLNDFVDDNISAAVLGYQIVGKNPDNNSEGVRLEATLMSASRKPEADFNQLEVVDAEESSGFGLTLVAQDNSGRLRFNGGFARSTFTNPSREEDPELTEDVDIVPVESTTENAYFLEAEYDLLRDVKLGGERTLTLTLRASHERIDPQFNTIGASVTADQLLNQVSLNGKIAGASVELKQMWDENNLADVPTLATTKKRDTAFNLTVPLQNLLAVKNSLLPTLSYSFNRNRSFTENTPEPVNTLESDVLTTTHTFGINWNIQNFNIGYNLESIFQDNRKLSEAVEADNPPDQAPDTQQFTNTIKFGWQATPGLLLDLGYEWTSSRDLVTNITDFTSTPTLGITWQMDPSMTLQLNLSRRDDNTISARTFNRQDEVSVILTRTFKIQGPAGLELPGAVSLTYGLNSNSNRNRELNESTDGTVHTLAGNINISF